ncbi:LacI family DNA-binding transcriptional regulator [Micropruina sp.]|uniref:LacI family DNA-binding transcriptional regulator n=1 Tax=Micropruina sp. TaxID=2737536 RepID=UPI00262764EA|nr:LacI family DNA-binding transcriptional regulator [Micropruina sp.]
MPGSTHVRHVVTRADVARYAGVSTAVVSYVINNGPRPVAATTAERVKQAIDVLGYRPNGSARALRRGVSDTIGLVTPQLDNLFFAELSQEIEQLAVNAGKAVLLGNSLGDLRHQRQLIDGMLSRQIDGLIVRGSSSHDDPLAGIRTNVPCVLLDTMVPLPGRRSIGSDLRGGADQLVDHLIAVHGLTRIALVVGRDLPGLVDPREVGWRDALRRHGLPEGPIARAAFDRIGGYRAAQQLLAAPLPPQAVFASSDLQATGVLRALHETGTKVPSEVAVVSFDGTSESAFTYPALTVARQPVATIARRAYELLGDDGTTEAFEQLPTDLIVRQSCGCAGTTITP